MEVDGAYTKSTGPTLTPVFCKIPLVSTSPSLPSATRCCGARDLMYDAMLLVQAAGGAPPERKYAPSSFPVSQAASFEPGQRGYEEGRRWTHP